MTKENKIEAILTRVDSGMMPVQAALNEILIIFSEAICVCTPDERTGTTQLWCCNGCGKPIEKF